MSKREPFVIWWIPAIVLLAVIWPMSFRWTTVYLEFGMPCIGLFFAWLFARSLMRAKENKQYLNKAAIYFLLMLTYNPFSYSVSLVSFVAQINHTYLILLNLLCAALVLYLWWVEKVKK